METMKAVLMFWGLSEGPYLLGTNVGLINFCMLITNKIHPTIHMLAKNAHYIHACVYAHMHMDRQTA
jgi:hypothetical protein